MALIVAAFAFIAVLGFVLAGVEISQALFVGADEFIGLGVIVKMIRAEGMLANDFGVAVVMGILVEGVVFEVIAYPVLFEIVIILGYVKKIV